MGHEHSAAAERERIFVLGMNYKTAAVAIRESFGARVASPAFHEAILASRAICEEVVVLRTCNRVEVYGVPAAGVALADITRHLCGGSPAPEMYLHQGREAVHHLLSVSSGMDSMVLGETEITGQIKNAYEAARKQGSTGKRLNKLFQKALETAKEIRTVTAIGKGAASVGSVAVQHARKIFGASLDGRDVMIIGAGNMAEKCLRHLVKKGVGRITVVNRSVEKAEQLAVQFNGTAAPFGHCLEAMAAVDIVITSTGSPHIILERGDIEHVMRARDFRPLVIIDIAVPRDVAPEAREIPGVHLHDIGDLEDTVRENIRYREQDLALCWSIIGGKTEEFEAVISGPLVMA